MILRRIARPMLASWFVYNGVHAVTRPQEHLAAARAGTDLVGSRVATDTELTDKQLTLVVRAHGAAVALAGTTLALGVVPRTSALALAALNLPLAVVNEPLSNGPRPRSERTPEFVRAVGAIGAALIAGADYEGRPGVQWRIAQARKDLSTSVELAGKDAQMAVHAATDSVKDSGRRAARRAKKAVHATGV
ncbi:DoxX family membrane protein [Paraoerskovia marina]|uniref:DoxX family membrane protein n=1 Tax=Paraoerskovia marina TaxID=545619 RepID=UPI000AD204F4|nr:DoxX family membrane protein [Paraoerskovia marina]